MKVAPKKFLNMTPTPKIAPQGQNSAKQAPNLAESKTSKPKLIENIGRFQNVFEPSPNPKSSYKGPKK